MSSSRSGHFYSFSPVQEMNNPAACGGVSERLPRSSHPPFDLAQDKPRGVSRKHRKTGFPPEFIRLGRAAMTKPQQAAAN